MEEFRGQGVGSALMRAALSAAETIGLERVELEVFPTSAPVIVRYEQVGFRAEGRKMRAAKIGGQYLDSIQMALFLRNYEV